MKLLIATNNFWIGGRETYVGTWLRELGYPASLIASQIEPGVPELDAFDETVECAGAGYEQRFAMWLDRGGEVIRRMRPAVIWAHHFDVLPAWLLSRLHGVPLLTTFHGPLIGAGRPNDLMQALGVTLAIHRGDAVTAVSEESAAAIRTLHPAAGVRLLPNTVSIADAPEPLTLPPRRFVLLTRRDKLEHIRQAALLFARYARRVAGSTLVVADGEMKFDAARSLRGALRQLGGRWAAAQGVGFLRRLPRIHFIGWTADPRGEIRAADAVLGMGRVVLEALGEGRPAVLVGYEQVHGLVTAANFDPFRLTNFSGRGMPATPHEEVVNELLALRTAPDLGAKRDAISVSAWAPRLRALLEETAAVSVEADFAPAAAEAIREGRGAAALFNIVAQSLRTAELETLYRVAEG